MSDINMFNQILEQGGIKPPPIRMTDDNEPIEVDDELEKLKEEKQKRKDGLDNDGEQELKDQSKTIDEFANDEDYIKRLEQYGYKRFGKNGLKKEGESNKSYFQRFVTHTRQFEWNPISLAGQIDWDRQASDEDKENFAYLYSELQKLPNFWEDGGDNTLRAVRDYAFSIASDPTVLIGFGAGKIATTAATRLITQSFKQAIKEQVKKGVAKDVAFEIAKKETMKKAASLGFQASKKSLAIAAPLEAIGGAGMSLGTQRIEKTAGLRDDVSLAEGAVAGGLTAVIGGGLGTFAARGLGKSTAKEITNAGTKLAQEVVKKETAKKNLQVKLKKETDNNYEFDPVNGFRVREKLAPIDKSGLTESQMQVEIQKRMGKLATEIAEDVLDKGGDNAELLAENLKGSKATEAIGKVLQNFADEKTTNIDTDILEGALKRNGIKVEEFLDFAGVSTSDAAKTLNSKAVFAKKILSRIQEIDPEAAKRIELLYGNENRTVGYMNKGVELYHRVDRELRAMMVSQLSTTVRNVATATVRLPMESVSNLIESSIYHLGKSGNALLNGKVSSEGIMQGITEIAKDSFGTLAYLNSYGTTKELSEVLLQDNSRLSNVISRSLSGITSGPGETLTKASRFFNGLNMAQDTFFRRAVFVQSVDKQLRRAGMQLDDFIASGKVLPPKVLQRSVDEAVDFTFARMPRRHKGQAGYATGDNLAFHFIRFNEGIGFAPGLLGIPLGTGALPFARFMANAMKFQLEYSPVSAIKATARLGGYAMKKYGKGLTDAQSAQEIRKIREEISKGIVGTAALTAATYYRINNQDVAWYHAKTDDGRKVDTRPYFPISPYLMVGDIIAKMYFNKEGRISDIDTKEVLEGLTGASFRAGASSYMIENFFDGLSEQFGIDKETPTTSSTGNIVFDLTKSFESPKGEKMAEYMGGYLGEIGGRGFTPIKMVGDIIAQFDDESAKVRDFRQLEGVGIERGVDSFKKAITRQLPYRALELLGEELPLAVSPTKEGPIFRQSPIKKQITGAIQTEFESDIQKELANLGYEDFQIVPSTGNKEADALVKTYMGIAVANRIADEITSEDYINSTLPQKKIRMKNKLKRFRMVAKYLAEEEAEGKAEGKPTGFDKAKYSKLPSILRTEVNEFYRESTGKGVIEMQKEEPNINHLRAAVELAKILNKMYQ